MEKAQGDDEAEPPRRAQSQTEKCDPGAEGGRTAAQDSQSGADGLRLVHREEKADRLGPGRRQTEQHDLRAGDDRPVTQKSGGPSRTCATSDRAA